MEIIAIDVPVSVLRTMAAYLEVSFLQFDAFTFIYFESTRRVFYCSVMSLWCFVLKNIGVAKQFNRIRGFFFK